MRKRTPRNGPSVRQLVLNATPAMEVRRKATAPRFSSEKLREANPQRRVPSAMLPVPEGSSNGRRLNALKRSCQYSSSIFHLCCMDLNGMHTQSLAIPPNARVMRLRP